METAAAAVAQYFGEDIASLSTQRVFSVLLTFVTNMKAAIARLG